MSDRPLHQPHIVLDFDGVLHSYTSGWCGPVPTDPPTPGAVDFVRWLLSAGVRVTIVTTRAATPEGFDGVRAWLVAHQFPEAARLLVTDQKVPAHLYLDDRGLRFEGDFATIKAWLLDRRLTWQSTWIDAARLAEPATLAATPGSPNGQSEGES